ncbi:MAG TPA: hypothetical protein DCE65_08765 [Clostridiales bacterium]|nr:hypothetical protein [Clostridiales bacterium]
MKKRSEKEIFTAIAVGKSRFCVVGRKETGCPKRGNTASVKRKTRTRPKGKSLRAGILYFRDGREASPDGFFGHVRESGKAAGKEKTVFGCVPTADVRRKSGRARS